LDGVTCHKVVKVDPARRRYRRVRGRQGPNGPRAENVRRTST